MSGINIQQDVNLKDKTTFHIGGKAKYYVEVENVDTLVEAINFARDNGIDLFILGGGSNILIDDDGIDALVVKYSNKEVSFKEEGQTIEVTAGAGLSWDDLVQKTVNRNLQGIECMSGIPGSVGAAPIQNIGAYGQELKDVFVKLKAYDFTTDKIIQMDKKQCKFGYRDSIFKKKVNKSRYFILNVTLILQNNSKPDIKYNSLQEFLDEKGIKDPTLRQVRQSVLQVRAQKLEDPNVLGNAGSFFKNPIINNITLEKIKQKYEDVPSYTIDKNRHKLFAGWLIDKAGWKGKSVGNARVSDKNALVITNPGKATSEEIKSLAEKIIDDVYAKFGIKLEPEVNIL